jgi:protoporphyrinogen/coproporphyrinogen III oxidase
MSRASNSVSGQGPVFVIGAGPSGLAATWRLREAGHEVIVLEERDRVGGQLKTVERDGFLIECGTVILPEAYDSVMGLVRDTGMLDQLQVGNSLMGFMRDGELHYLRADRLALDAARTRLLSLRSKLAVGRLALDAARLRRALSYDDLSAGAAYDAETPEQYARRRGLDGELYDYLIEPTIRGGAGVPGDVISVVEFFFLWQKVLGSKLYAFERGYSSFTERLATAVRLGARVSEVVEDGDGVRVTWTGPDGERTERGAGAIVTAMGNRVPDLIPQLAPERARFLRDLDYTATMSINLALSDVPDCPASFVVIPRPVHDGMFAIILEHNKAPGRTPAGKGLVSLFMMNQWALDHWDHTDEEILAEVLPVAEQALPGVSGMVEFSQVNRWFPVLVYSHPGLYRELGVFHAARDRSSRIHLGGSFTSSGNVNTATTAGERAARELMAAMAGR